MLDTVEQLAVRHKLPLSLEYNANLGYHISVIMPRDQNVKISDLPAEFIQVSRRSTRWKRESFSIIISNLCPFCNYTQARKGRRSLTMTTMALLTLNKQCKKACEEIYLMSNTQVVEYTHYIIE